MGSYFTSEFFKNNRRRLRTLVSDDALIIVTANGLLQRGADSTYPFSQDASFWYLTGIEEPDALLIIDRHQEYLIVPERDAYRLAFDGAVSNESLAKRSGVDTVVAAEIGWQRLEEQLKTAPHVATLAASPAYIEQYGMFTNPARARLFERLSRAASQHDELLDIAPVLSRLRMVKQPPELQAIQQAIDITIASLKTATTAGARKKYNFEFELEAEISKGFRQRGASGHAFEPIVASGVRACTLHNVANNGKLGADDLIVLDVGAEVEHYAADITRTISLHEPSPRKRAVYAGVLDVQQYAMKLLKPGVLLKEYEQAVEHYMGEKLMELGLTTVNTHETVRQYYPHATSHYLGLNVHDAGDYHRPLEPDMVLTVEPGIYIPEEGIGIRIEDDVVVTASGIRVLTNKLSRELH